MKKSTLFYFAAWAMLCPMAAKSQRFFEPSEVTVRLGERLPESFFDTVHDAVDMKTGAATQVRLGDHRDKLIILDFWATWCGPCIGSLNKLDTIKREMRDPRFVVIPVTGQFPADLRHVIDRYRWDTPSIVGDSVLAKIFPHDGIPHMVWIKDGRVVAIPHAMYATKENITAVLNGQRPRMMMNIRDQVLDPMKPLFVKGNGETGLWFKGENSKIARFVKHYRGVRTSVVHKGDSTIVYCSNQPVLALFHQAFQRDIFQHLTPLNGGFDLQVAPALKGRLLEGPPPISPSNTPAQDSAYLAWHEMNVYGYELRVKGRLSEADALRLMRQDIEDFFSIYMGLSARVVPGPKHRYGVLKLRGTKDETMRLLTQGDLPGDGGQENMLTFNNGQYYSHLYSLMAGGALKKSPGLNLTIDLVDSTGIERNTKVRIYFPKTLLDGKPLHSINEELGRYGLYIELEEKNVPILELSEMNTAAYQPVESSNQSLSSNN